MSEGPSVYVVWVRNLEDDSITTHGLFRDMEECEHFCGEVGLSQEHFDIQFSPLNIWEAYTHVRH